LGRPRTTKDPAKTAIRINDECKKILDMQKGSNENYGITVLRLIKEAISNKKKARELDERVYLLEQEIKNMQWEINYLEEGNQGHLRVQGQLKMDIFNLQAKLAEREKIV
jgi:hypothetical protein